jgi:hypothetical protein
MTGAENNVKGRIGFEKDDENSGRALESIGLNMQINGSSREGMVAIDDGLVKDKKRRHNLADDTYVYGTSNGSEASFEDDRPSPTTNCLNLNLSQLHE